MCADVGTSRRGSALRTVAVALLLVGGIGYADWVAQLFLPVHADLTTSFVSELSAGGQPYAAFFRNADLVGGILLVAGGALAWASSRRWSATWLWLIVLGLCVALEASMPLNATFTFAAHLPEVGTHAWWHRVSEPHGVVSLLESVSFVALLVVCTAAQRRVALPERRVRLVLGLGLAALLCGLTDSLLTAVLLVGGHSGPLGLVQRLGVTLTAAWLAAAPTSLLLAHAGRPADERPRQESSTSRAGSR